MRVAGGVVNPDGGFEGERFDLPDPDRAYDLTFAIPQVEQFPQKIDHEIRRIVSGHADRYFPSGIEGVDDSGIMMRDAVVEWVRDHGGIEAE